MALTRLAAGFAMTLLAASVSAQTTYDSKTLVDTNNNSTSTSTVNSSNTTTSTSTSTVNSSNTNTNTNTNYNVNSGTTTVNNNNVNSGIMTYNNNNVNTGDMTYRNINTTTSDNNSTNVNINSGTMTYNNNNVSSATNNNVNTSTSTSDNKNVNVNTSVSDNKNTNVNTSTNSNVNQNIQSGEMTNKNINDTTMRVIQPPPTAVAPAMMSGGNTDLCTTGTSGSVQTQIFGVSTGGTVRDLNCERLKLSKTLYDMGMKVAAVATMCQDRRVYDAMMQAGTPCPYEGKIGEQARAAWEANPDKLPKLDEPKQDDTFKKIGLGSVLGIAVAKLFGI